MRFLLSLVFLLSVVGTLEAQQLRSAIGVRFGTPTSVSAKFFLDDVSAIEAFVGLKPYLLQPYNYTTVGAAYLYHFDLAEIDGDFSNFSVYAGGGAGAQFWRYDDEFYVTRRRGDFNSLGIRVSAYVGGQYVFDDAPIELTVDYSPSLVLGDVFFNGLRFGFYTLGARYIIGRQ